MKKTTPLRLNTASGNFKLRPHKIPTQNDLSDDEEILDITQTILDIQSINETIRVMKEGFDNA